MKSLTCFLRAAAESALRARALVWVHLSLPVSLFFTRILPAGLLFGTEGRTLHAPLPLVVECGIKGDRNPLRRCLEEQEK